MELMGIKLLKNNDNKNWSDLEWVTEFYEFLQGEIPETISMENPMVLSPEEAYNIIWYLQEHFPIIPSNIEKCDNCNELYDADESGFYSESGNEIGHYFCSGCDHLAPLERECICCNHLFDEKNMKADNDDNYYCPECWKELSPKGKSKRRN